MAPFERTDGHTLNHFAIDIKSPGDFVKTLIFDDYLVTPLRTDENGSEGDSRLIIGEIFDGLAFIDRDDESSVSEYLRSVRLPICNLQSAGYQLFGLVSVGYWRNHVGMRIEDWKRVYYFIVRAGACLAFDAPYPVTRIHQFTPHCPEAVAQLVRSSSLPRPFRTWRDKHAVLTHFDNRVPWCPVCCPDEAPLNNPYSPLHPFH